MPIDTIETIIQQDIPRNILPPAYEFDKAEPLVTLKAFGFIKKRHGGASYDIHRLVHTTKLAKAQGRMGDLERKDLEADYKCFPTVPA